jgi:hypothetical protein
MLLIYGTAWGTGLAGFRAPTVSQLLVIPLGVMASAWLLLEKRSAGAGSLPGIDSEYIFHPGYTGDLGGVNCLALSSDSLYCG